MSLSLKQLCEMCGKTRELDKNRSPSGFESPDLGGWRTLNAGSKEVTLCNECITLVVDHAKSRKVAREGGYPGTINDRPLTLMFSESREK